MEMIEKALSSSYGFATIEDITSAYHTMYIVYKFKMGSHGFFTRGLVVHL